MRSLDPTLTVADYMDEIGSRALGRPPDPAFPTAMRLHLDRAARHGQMGRAQAPTGPLRLAKRVVLRLAQVFARDQVTCNAELIEALARADERIKSLEARVAELQQGRSKP